MKVIAINSSARSDGNTSFLLNIVLNELNKEGIKTEMISLAGHIIEPCKACWGCIGHENCVHQTDRFHEMFDKMKEADGIILGSPVYCANISSTMQAILERAAVVGDMNQGILKYKAGAAVIAARRGGAVNAFDSINHFFLNHEMFVAGSTYWNIGYGRLPQEVKNDSEALENMKNLGQNMAYLIKALNKNHETH